MYCSVTTAVLSGVDSTLVTCEADISDGLPVFDMVGFLSTEVRESRERIRTAVRNLGLPLPARRITINISPASIRKSGTAFDLPTAIAILAASGAVPKDHLDEVMMAGELSLDGDLLGIRGALPIALKALETGHRFLIIPSANAREAALVKGLTILPVHSLRDVLDLLNMPFSSWKEASYKKPASVSTGPIEDKGAGPDFSILKGQRILRRAAEIACSGRHHLLMIGPPGSGKTLAAECMATILPPMTEEEQLLLSSVYSVAGLLRSDDHLMDVRPIRSPHHTATSAGMTGGGRNPKPGEITLASSGILFLDELPEFRREVLEILREPLESRHITISREGHTVTYPADFLMICAMNPCPCGYYPDLSRCTCTTRQVRSYLSRISQPLLDRIDITVETEPLSYRELSDPTPMESSEVIQERVARVRSIQADRYRGYDFSLNSDLPVSLLSRFCPLSKGAREFLKKNFDERGFSARSYHRILKVARTIADMEGKEEIEDYHLMEAFSYRSPDRRFFDPALQGREEAI